MTNFFVNFCKDSRLYFLSRFFQKIKSVFKMMKKEIKKVNTENRIQKRLARTKVRFLIGSALIGRLIIGPVSQNLKSVAAFLSQTSFCPVDGLKIRQITSIEATRPIPIALVIICPYPPDVHQGLWSPNLIFHQIRTMI